MKAVDADGGCCLSLGAASDATHQAHLGHHDDGKAARRFPCYIMSLHCVLAVTLVYISIAMYPATYIVYSTWVTRAADDQFVHSATEREWTAASTDADACTGKAGRSRIEGCGHKEVCIRSASGDQGHRNWSACILKASRIPLKILADIGTLNKSPSR